MAYMSQEKKAEIQVALKRILPKSWKWSLSVRHHSTIVLTVAAAPVDLIDEYTKDKCSAEVRESCIRQQSMQMNPYHWGDHFTTNPELHGLFTRIFSALNAGNHDRSDLQTDYFDVGWYVEINVGRWNKPFVNLSPMKAAA